MTEIFLRIWQFFSWKFFGYFVKKRVLKIHWKGEERKLLDFFFWCFFHYKLEGALPPINPLLLSLSCKKLETGNAVLTYLLLSFLFTALKQEKINDLNEDSKSSESEKNLKFCTKFMQCVKCIDLLTSEETLCTFFATARGLREKEEPAYIFFEPYFDGPKSFCDLTEKSNF